MLLSFIGSLLQICCYTPGRGRHPGIPDNINNLNASPILSLFLLQYDIREPDIIRTCASGQDVNPRGTRTAH